MSALHEFDFRLCEYVHYNIGVNFEDQGFAKAVTSPLPRELADYLQQETRTESGDFRPVLLNYDELMRLHSVIDFTSLKHGRHWTAFRDIHSFSTQCTGEIHRRLAPAEARKWAEVSERIAQTLEHHPLSLADGIWTLYDWIGELRWYMEAMGDEHLIAFPSGQFPTPTNPAPVVSAAPPVSESEQLGPASTEDCRSGASEETRMSSAAASEEPPVVVAADDDQPEERGGDQTAVAETSEPHSAEASPGALTEAEPDSAEAGVASHLDARQADAEDTTSRLSTERQRGDASSSLVSASDAQDEPATGSAGVAKAYVDRMRLGIKKHPEGRSAKPAALRKLMGVSEQGARDALRLLQDLGEYDGFYRERPECYRRG